MKFLTVLFSTLLHLSITLAAHDHPSVHGMLMVGQQKVYLSHLPMFHSPHDYQAIFEATLSSEALQVYKQNQAVSKDNIFTLVPEVFVLPDMAANPRPFKAQIYKGHFERGGTKIADATVEVKVLYFKKFNPVAVEPAKPQFILFGNNQEQFAAHQIFAKPNFDQIYSVTVTANEARELDAGNTILTVTLQNEKSLYLEIGDLSH